MHRAIWPEFFYQHGPLLSNEPHTFRPALLQSRHCSCLFIFCPYGPLQKTVRLALSNELLSSSGVTVAPHRPCPLHLSPCLVSSFIYCNAFAAITQQLSSCRFFSFFLCLHTRAHSHASKLAHDQSKIKAVVRSPFDSF